jgi:hypothetical protein
VGFKAVTAASMKMSVFWGAAPCRLVEVYRRFRGAHCFHLQGGESLAYLDSKGFQPVKAAYNTIPIEVWLVIFQVLTATGLKITVLCDRGSKNFETSVSLYQTALHISQGTVVFILIALRTRDSDR